jgi:hypothetical protein
VLDRRPAAPTPFPAFVAQSSGGMSFWICFLGDRRQLALEGDIGGGSTRRRHLVLVEVGRLADDHRAAAVLLADGGAAAQLGADQRVEHFADGETANGEALGVGIVIVVVRVVVVKRARRRRPAAPTLQQQRLERFRHFGTVFGHGKLGKEAAMLERRPSTLAAAHL